jgi:hypothetical protein
MFEALLDPRARWVLDRLADIGPAEAAQIWECIHRLELDPYPGPELRAPLTTPGRTYPAALRCGEWLIAFHVEDHLFVIVDDIGLNPRRRR